MLPTTEEMMIGMKINHQWLQLVAKQNRITAGQDAAATTESAVSVLLRSGGAGGARWAISGLAAGVRCHGGISKECCCWRCCQGGC